MTDYDFFMTDGSRQLKKSHSSRNHLKSQFRQEEKDKTMIIDGGTRKSLRVGKNIFCVR
jgi:hypothetical protein